MKLNSYEINKIVEYIRHHHEGMVFDAFEVAEDIDAVLSYYGFCLLLDNEDKENLKVELLSLAIEFELHEVGRLAAMEV